MTKNQLADALRTNVFADRGTDLQAAMEYASDLIESMPDQASKIPAWTAFHVVLNTVSNCIRELPDALPATPETVTLPRADDPSRGSWSEYDLLMLINKAIESWADDHLNGSIRNWVEENIDLEHEIDQHLENNVDFTEIIRDELRSNLTLSISVD